MVINKVWEHSFWSSPKSHSPHWHLKSADAIYQWNRSLGFSLTFFSFCYYVSLWRKFWDTSKGWREFLVLFLKRSRRIYKLSKDCFAAASFAQRRIDLLPFALLQLRLHYNFISFPFSQAAELEPRKQNTQKTMKLFHHSQGGVARHSPDLYAGFLWASFAIAINQGPSSRPLERRKMWRICMP